MPDPTEQEQSVEDVLAPLDTLAERPLEEHPDVFQQIHTTLQASLTDIDVD